APVVTIVAFGVFGLESLRVDYLFDFWSFYHWGVFTGPADTVRQGGWLLWDVPATYGFLSTLAIAGVPTASVWDGFFLLNSAACFAAMAVLFLFLRARLDPLAAAVVSLAAVVWLPGHTAGGGVLATPNAGAFRFVWCQLLLGLAVIGTRRPALWV